jgi:hypothetical protein
MHNPYEGGPLGLVEDQKGKPGQARRSSTLNLLHHPSMPGVWPRKTRLLALALALARRPGVQPSPLLCT